MYLIGYDIGSSSVKVSLLEADSGKTTATTSPAHEMEIAAPHPGWAEQSPQTWWDNAVIATQKVLADSGVRPADIKAVGISYQMHGLVLVDKDQQPLRPAIIWCDSRAVEIGDEAFEQLGKQECLERLLNSPGNFTTTRIKWVKDNEPKVYRKVHKAMLPGDYIAMKMTGEITTTPSGLSEGILWDFQEQKLADWVLEYFEIDCDLIPRIVPTFSVQGQLTQSAASQLGLAAGTPIAYRAGDQPNNALSLNVLNPGEIAATAGTSGVVYGVGDKHEYDTKSRVNTFAHVNHTDKTPRYGVLLCVNGTGILNSWLKCHLANGLNYVQMNELAATAPIGANGLTILPYGNGAERTLKNDDIGAVISGLKFNTHNTAHLLRAGQEGIVFALDYGLDIMRHMGIEVNTVRAGHANMFLSPLFAEAFATTTGATVELYDTDGAAGAARGAGIGAGVYKDFKDAFENLTCKGVIEPNHKQVSAYRQAYRRWLDVLSIHRETEQ
jgi:xylulokinase